MGIFKTSNVDEYFDEKERREKFYKKLSNDPVKTDGHELLERVKQLDEAYLDWHERVIFEQK